MRTIKIYLLAAIAATGSGMVHSQECPQEVSTDPRNPSNTQRPEFENTFFWFPHNGNTAQNFPILPAGGILLPSVSSPFYNPSTTLQVGQLVGLDESDFWPEDGWELLKVNFGYLNDGTERGTKPGMPYMVLYNKYSGTMRFLGMFPNSADNYKIVRFRISLPEKRIGGGAEVLDATNLLSIQGDAAQPLDQETEENVYEIVTEWPGISNADYFFWFDLPVAYDPCICDNDVAILFEAEVVSTWDIKIEGTFNGDIIQQGTPNAQGNSALVAKRIIGAAGATALAIASGGSIMQTSQFAGLLEIFSQRPGASEQAKRNAKFFKDIIEASAGVLYDPSKLEWRNIVTDSTMTKKDWDKFTSGVGAFLNSGIDYFNPVPKALLPRSTMVGSITATGTATQTLNAGSIVYLGAPGSNWTLNLDETMSNSNVDSGFDPEYPIYNNPLGTMALLKTPTINVKRDEIPFCVNYNGSQYGRQLQTVFTLFFDQEELLYYFNPALHLNQESHLLSLKASIVVRGKTKNFLKQIYGDGSLTYCDAWPLELEGFDEYSLLRGVNIYESIDQRERLSPPVEIDYLNDMVVIFTSNHSNAAISDYDFFIRFHITGESHDIGKDGLPNKIDQVISFPLNPVQYEGESSGIDIEDIPLEIIDIMNYTSTFGTYELPFNPYVLPLEFGTGAPHPYQTGDNAYDENFVEIETEISSPLGLSTISSATGIRLKPGTRLSNSIKLRIGVPLPGSFPQQEVSAEYLSDFCAGLTSTPYQTNSFSAKAYKGSPLPYELIEPYIDKQKIGSISIYPNPARSELTVQTDGAGIDRLTIFDMSTRPVMQASPGGQSLYRMDISSLAPGVYIVQANSGGEVLTEKLVVAR